jgi:hypothetical protein
MAAPQEYDLSYRTNIGGMFLPPEYISQFVAGETMALVRRILNPPHDVQAVNIVIKKTQGALNALIVKNVTNVLDQDGEVQTQADHSWLFTLLFSSAETLLLQQKSYFLLQVVFDDGSTEVLSNGYVWAGQDQPPQTAQVHHVLILNPVGEIETGQFQIDARAYDVNNIELPGVPMYYFSSSQAIATVNDTGLLNAEIAGTVTITAGTTQGNVAYRATFTIT